MMRITARKLVVEVERKFWGLYRETDSLSEALELRGNLANFWRGSFRGQDKSVTWLAASLNSWIHQRGSKGMVPG
jgi:hypothetical protein